MSSYEDGWNAAAASLRGMHDRDLAARDDSVEVLRQRVLRLGGFQRTDRGAFWISRDDVMSLIDEVFPRA